MHSNSNGLMIERLLTLSQKMESKPQLQTLSGSLLERLTRALVPLVYVRAYATQENLKRSSPQ